eukprot:10190224-Alexandrium_andersonii.AAC.1
MNPCACQSSRHTWVAYFTDAHVMQTTHMHSRIAPHPATNHIKHMRKVRALLSHIALRLRPR